MTRKILSFDSAQAAKGHASVEAAPGLQLHGFAVAEAVGAGATLSLRHGSQFDPSPVLVPIVLKMNETLVSGPWPIGIDAPQGIFVDIDSGTVRIVVYASYPNGDGS